MVFGSVAISFRCAFLSGIECFLLWKNISNFAEATREKRFTTMTPLCISRDVTCHRIWRHNCFLNSIQLGVNIFYFNMNITKFTWYFSLYQKNKRTFQSPLVCVLLRCVISLNYGESYFFYDYSHCSTKLDMNANFAEHYIKIQGKGNHYIVPNL